MPTALPSNTTRSEGQSEASSRVKEYHGSVLNYRLATPKHSGGPQQQSPFFEESADEAVTQSSQPWPEAAAEAQASSSSAEQQPFDPFAGGSSTHASEHLHFNKPSVLDILQPKHTCQSLSQAYMPFSESSIHAIL